MSRDSDSKLTFGNILLSLLLLGTIVVIGLIGFVYFELTRTPQHAPLKLDQPTDSTQQKIDALSPQGKTQSIYQERRPSLPPQASQAQPTTENNKQTAEAVDAPVYANDVAPPVVKPKPPKPPKPPREKTQTAQEDTTIPPPTKLSPNNNKGEVVLQPTNTPAPRRETGERTLQPKNIPQNIQPLNSGRSSDDSGNSRSRNQNSGGGERVLQPKNPPRQQQNDGGSNIDNLF